MKSSWMIVLGVVAIVAVTFSVAFIEGANAVLRDAADETTIAAS